MLQRLCVERLCGRMRCGTGSPETGESLHLEDERCVSEFVGSGLGQARGVKRPMAPPGSQKPLKEVYTWSIVAGKPESVYQLTFLCFITVDSVFIDRQI
ncbi:hypothetical protein AOLI_G00142220 [Acnodon oligacanthus]